MRYAGPEEVKIGEKPVNIHKFVSGGKDLKTIYFLVNDNHELLKIMNDDNGGENIEIILTTKQDVIDNWDY